jgi:peptide deformylase
MRGEPVEGFDDELARVTERMTALMHDAEGVGLAATQVGILRRFFVCTLMGEDRVLVNPVLTPLSDDAEVDSEGCLSLGPIRLPVERAVRVRVEARDAQGEPVALELEGIDARVVQHELDHLDGTLIIDRTADSEARREALRQLRPRLVLA